jgi:branched-chain amino acid transport system permease protein
MSTSASFAQVRTALKAGAREARSAWSFQATLAVLVLAAALLAPAVLPLSDRMPDLAGFVYLAVAAVGLAYAVGLAGIPSLGQGAFLGIGAFAEAIARAKWGWPLLPALLLGVGAATAGGVLTGLATGRLRAAFVAVSTWILTWIVALTLVSFPEISGGAQGLVLPEAEVLGHPLGPTAHYELGILLLALAILVYAVLAPRAPGLALAAARDRSTAATRLGVPVARLRLGAFTASAGIAGLAGALGVELAQVADPSAYDATLSFKLFVAVILGGARTPLGPVLGLAVIAAFSHGADQIGALRGLPPGRLEEMLTGYGLLLVLGLGGAGLLPTALAWWRRRYKRARTSSRLAAASFGTADAPAPLAMHGLSKRFGSLVALDDLYLELAPGSVHALIGPNGSGKTTALRLVVGELRPDAGSIAVGHEELDGLTVRGRALRGVVGTQQTTEVFSGLTVLESAVVGAGLRRRHGGALRTVFATPKSRAEAAAVRRKAASALELVGLGQNLDRPAAELSAYEQRLLMLATALATEPRVLLLDEPAAGAGRGDLEHLAEVLAGLRARGLALLVIEHNLRFVRRIADWVSVLEAGRLIASGSLGEVAANPAVQTAYLGRQRL